MKTIRGRIEDVEIEIDIHKKPLKAGNLNDLDQQDLVRYNVVIFKKEGKEPVFLAIERENNQCSATDLKQSLYAQALIEQQPHRHAMNQFIKAEEMEWFELKKNDILNKVNFAMPPMGKGKVMKPYVIAGATVKQLDQAIKKNLGTEQNIASEFFARGKKLENAETLDRAQIKKTDEVANRQRLQEKLENLNKEDEKDLIEKAMKRKPKL